MRPERAIGVALVLCGGLASAPGVLAQDSDLRRAVLAPTVQALQSLRADPAELARLLDDQVLTNYPVFVLAAATRSANGQFIVEANRLDKQVGASGRGRGTTTLVSSGSVPRILGFALETGAMTQSVTGTSVTFQTNPAGLAQVLARGASAAGEPFDDAASRNTLNVLRRFNVGLTFDAGQDSARGLTGSYRQLQQVSAQFYVHNRRDPTHPAWREVWLDFARRAGSGLANVTTALALDLRSQPEFQALQAGTRARILAAATDEEIEQALVDHAARFEAFVSSDLTARMLDAWASYLRAQGDVYRSLARSQIVTLEYQLDRPPVQDAPADMVPAGAQTLAPDLSTARLIWVRPFLGASDMTVNGSVSFFNSEAPGMPGLVRDWQVGGKLDFPLNGTFGFSRAQLTVAALYMRLRQSPLGVPAIVNDVPVDLAGHIRLVQARLRIPVSDSGFSVPVSFTYANRTELVTGEAQVRGNIGLTLDVDKLIGR